MSPFSGATLMITGGTGSFGNTVLKHFLTSDIGEIPMALIGYAALSVDKQTTRFTPQSIAA